tara:strand:- start:6975 stop:7832 length:858 start_codon:yes stop_codon:yes gene_type:complete
MNIYQITQQIKYLIQKRTWDDQTGTGSNLVFNSNSVCITVGPSENAFSSMIPPICLIRPGSANADPVADEDPNLLMQGFEILLGVVVPGDAVGQNALIGGNRQSNDSSKGRGLLEVEEQLLQSVALLNSVNGVEMYNRTKSEATATLDEASRYVVYREYGFEAMCAVARYYPPCTRVTAVDATGGDATISYFIPPERFDGVGSPRILRVSGATPTTDPNDAGATVVQAGAGVQPLSPMPYSITDSPGAGQFSYSVWAIYDDSGNEGSITGFWRYSPVATATVTVT